ncbi:hypothetical protein ABIF64_008328 [Bradyrhizobium japonicum]
MRRRVLRNLFLASSLVGLAQLMTPTDADAEARLALVIGQSAYRTVPELPNAANDAKGMTELLGNAGFTVTTAANLAQNEMRAAISDFAGKVSASGADTVALVFYAGHGLQIDGENYLVPVDLDPKREADIPLQGVRLNDLLNTLGALPTRARIFMLDACRNNPFPALSGAGHGLAIVDTKAGAPGSFISYSTSPGAEAAGRLRHRQPLHHGRADRRQATEPADRGSVQAHPHRRGAIDRRAADPVGKLVADDRLQVLRRREQRRTACSPGRIRHGTRRRHAQRRGLAQGFAGQGAEGCL